MSMFTWAKHNFDPDKDCILITGASSGIGYEYLKLALDIGGRIYVVSDEKEKLNEIAETLTDKKSTIIPIVCDFSCQEEVKKFTDTIKHLRIKILINNAGIGMKGPFLSHSPEDIVRIYNINTITPLKILLATLPFMKKNNCGVVVQVTTVNVAAPIPLNAIYTGGKTGLSSTFLAIAFEERKSKIVFHELRPGTTETPFHEKQGVKPKSMLMRAEEVARRSANNIHEKVFHPNKLDRILVVVFGHFPLFLKMQIGLFLLKKRLGIK